MTAIRLKSATSAFLIISILGLGLYLRVVGLSGRGIIARDEVWHLYSARGLAHRLSTSVELASDSEYTLTETSLEKISSNNVAGKPTYVVALWILGLILQNWNYQITLILSVICGVVGLLLAWKLARAIRLGPVEAIVAPALLATSFSHLYFSRIGYPHALLIAVYAASLIYFMRSFGSKPLVNLALAGLAFGVGLSVHMSLVLALPGIFLAQFYQTALIEGKPRDFVRRASVLASGIVLPLLFWELLYHAFAKVLGSRPGVASLSGSYLLDALRHSGTGSIPTYGLLGKLLFYPLVLVGMENPVVSLFTVAGLVAVLRRRSDRGLTLGLIILVSNLALLIMFPAKYGRQIAPLLVLWAIIGARGVAVVVGWINARHWISQTRGVGPTIVIMVILFNLYWDLPLLSSRSGGFKQAAEWLEASGHREDKLLMIEISDAAIMHYYWPKRVYLWHETLNSQDAAEWYVKSPTDHLRDDWPQISRALIANHATSASFDDYWTRLRPHQSVGGDWLLIPWWRWSRGPSSFRAHWDDAVQVYARDQ